MKTFPICIQDFNDNAPLFVSPTKNFTVRVPENASLGSEMIAVQAIGKILAPSKSGFFYVTI